MTEVAREQPPSLKPGAALSPLKVSNDAQLEQLRTMLVGPEQTQLEVLRQRVDELEKLVPRLDQTEDVVAEHLEMLTARLTQVEATLVATDGRATAVGEVLVDAVTATNRLPGALGDALTPDVEHAVRASARLDSTVLAEALYPVMGPALRKMIANLFSMDASSRGLPFVVQKVFLIDRRSGLLLASHSLDGDITEDSIVVTGMLDAIKHFVQDAFDKPTHDGLQDLRVGDTSVLVEWGPHAALASVVTGIPTNDYRHHAAETLERLHEQFGPDATTFEGNTSLAQGAQADLASLFTTNRRPASLARQRWPWILATVLLVVLASALIWGI